MSQIKYRSDIDGLRAIAIISVLVFHAFPEYLPSGFIGVDIFFVISGFLISSILYKSISESNFSFIDFYQRRINRIFPALLTVLAFCCILGWFSLTQEEYKQLGKHIAAGAGFLSNFVLWSEINYFDNSAETKPLLHLWSLAIEEQFYLIWPPILLIIFRTKNRKIAAILTTLLIASLFFCIWGTKIDASATFYNPLTRFWELLCGALLAWLNHSNTQYKFTNSISTLGLTLVCIGFFVATKKSFPGWQAIFPTLGAALIIAAGKDAWVNKFILSRKFMVWVGLISYPLYLWHWPLLVFPKIISGQHLSVWIRVLLVVASIVAALATYFFIEKKTKKYQPAVVAKILLAGMFLMGLTGYWIYKSEGLPSRKFAQLQGPSGDIGHTKFHQYVATHYFPCQNKEIHAKADRWEGFVRCAQSKANSKIDIILLGDSHAEHLFIGLADTLRDKNVAFYTRSALPFMNAADSDYLIKAASNEKNATILIAAYWFGRTGLLAPNVKMAEELSATTQYLLNNGHKVGFILDTPGFTFEPESCMGNRWMKTNDRACTMKASAYADQTSIYESNIQTVNQRYPEVKVLKIGDAFCDKDLCRMTKDGVIYFRDFHHLNINGSIRAGQYLANNYAEFLK